MGRYRSSAQVMEKASSAVLHLLLWNIIHECRIWNSICAAELVFTSYPSDIVALTKRPLNISCAAVEKDHRTSASIIWFHNLKDPIPGLNVWVYRSHTGLLFFPSLREEDLGKYTCKAILGLSSINTTFNIYKAYIEPVFYSPSSQAVNTGESVSFHCVSGESRPLVEIKWTKDRRIVCEGFQFQGQYGGKNSLKVSGTLRIANVSKEDEGEYICATHNPLLNVTLHSTPATLKVKALMPKLLITKDPENITVAVGKTTTMHCTIQGSPRPNIMWYKNNKPLNDSREYKHDGNREVLMIRNVSLEDEGFYHCEGNNGNEVVTSQAAYLLPAAMGWKFIKQPCNVTARKGDSTTLQCRPPFSNPSARVSWFKNNYILNSWENPHLISKENGDLVFSSVEESDDGMYFCRASNPHIAHTVTSQRVSLKVLVLPNVTVHPKVNSVPLGSGATFHCQAEGRPTPSVVWYKGDQPIIAGRRIFLGFQNRTLHISSVVKSDEDLYICEATNLVGYSNQSTILSVTVAPVIVSFTNDLTVMNGSSAALTCTAIGDEIIVYSWYKNGHLIKTSEPKSWNKGQEILLLPRVNLTDEGTYRCVASSALGRDERTGKLRVHVPPSILFLNASIQVRHGLEFTLFCDASGIPKPSISWSFKNRPIIASNHQHFLTENGMLIIKKAMQSVEGIYECEVVNEEGSAKRSVNVSISAPGPDQLTDELSTSPSVSAPTISADRKHTDILHSDILTAIASNSGSVKPNGLHYSHSPSSRAIGPLSVTASSTASIGLQSPVPAVFVTLDIAVTSTVKQFSSPTISTVRPTSTSVLAAVRHFPSPQLSTMKPFPSPKMSTVKPFPSLPMSTVKPFPFLPMSTVKPFPTPEMSTVKLFPSAAMSTVKPFPSLVISTVKPFPSLPMSTMKPFPTPEMSIRKLFPSPAMSTVKPFPSLVISTVKPFPSLPMSTMKPFPTPEMSLRKLFPSPAMSTVKPFPSLVISTVKPFPSQAMSIAKPFPTPEMSTAKFFPSAAMSTVKPFPSLAMSTAKPFPSLVISTVKPFPSLPMSTMKPFPTPEMSIRKLFPSPAMSTVKPFPSLVISTVKPFPTPEMSTMKPFPTPEMSTMKPFPTLEMSTVKPFPSLAMSTVELFPSLAMSRVKHIPIPTRSTRNAFPSLITPVALDSPSLDTPVPKKHFAPMDVALNLTRDFSKVNGTTQISNVISLLKIYLPANPGKKTIFTHEQLKVYTRNSTLPSLGSYLHYLSKTATKYSSEPTAWNSNYTTSQPFHSSVGTSGTIIREKAKARESSSYFALEKHDIPIVVGVTLSLTMIFITMCVYSVRQKKNENKETERRLLRSSRMSSQNRGRFEMHTHDNRAFEEDSPSDAVEQTPHERQSVMASSPKQSSVKAIKVTAEFALVSQSESIISISGNNHLQTSHKDSSKVEQQDVKIPILSRSRSSLSHHEDRVKNPNTWKQSALFQEKPLTSVVMVELKRSSFTEEHQKVEMLTRSNSIPCYSKKASQREEQALFNASLHSDNKIQGASYFSLQTIERQPMNPGAVQFHSKLTPSDLSGNLSGTEKKCTEIRSIAADVRVYSQIPAAPSL